MLLAASSGLSCQQSIWDLLLILPSLHHQLTQLIQQGTSMVQQEIALI